MDATLNRSVDVGPTRARPGLALLLAVLPVPGTTMVWDLDVPLPGFWIGGPLGVAAIMLAIARAPRADHQGRPRDGDDRARARRARARPDAHLDRSSAS